MLGLLWVFLALLSITWVLSIIFIGFIFSMAANERRREMAVLRALGATRFFIFRTIITEAAILTLVAGVVGITLASTMVFLFRDAITQSLKMPFLFPSFTSLALLLLIGILLSVVTVVLSTFIPAYRVSRQEPALMMRE
jgi:putative ABC transport system permease protein